VKHHVTATIVTNSKIVFIINVFTVTGVLVFLIWFD